ncbi:MAG TPA: hypothetical protein VJY63_08100 [Marinospirillum sp.]|uniref:PA3496 family putative envelope integrity protein n=1 Tax=Marinospirillum sp. TaxID=2183934 RepID=UPI002B472ADD|nr:hypothetical protein [Marinospirillum sp.]HKM15866.1 hypothetical protein [Marinospirillum sp.]
MSREEPAFDDDDVFDAVNTDDDFEVEIDTKEVMTNRDGSPIDKRRMIEAMLEERRLRKQIEDDFDIDDDEDF